MTITGDPLQLGAFCAAHIQMLPESEPEELYRFDLNSVIPRPKVLEGTRSPDPEGSTPENQRALAETGFTDWHAWCIDRWGTKWNAYGFRWIERTPERLVFTFETAWACPYPVIEKLIGDYPKLEFVTKSFDEMWNWASIGTTLPTRHFHVLDMEPDVDMYKAVYGVTPEVTPLASEEVH